MKKTCWRIGYRNAIERKKKKSRLSPRFGPFERGCIVVPLTGEGRCLGRILEHGKFVYFYCVSEWRCWAGWWRLYVCVYLYIYAGESVGGSFVSDSVTPWTVALHGVLQAILQGIFPTQGSNPGFLYYRQILYHLNHQGSQDVYMYLESKKKKYMHLY